MPHQWRRSSDDNLSEVTAAAPAGKSCRLMIINCHCFLEKRIRNVCDKLIATTAVNYDLVDAMSILIQLICKYRQLLNVRMNLRRFCLG